MSERLPLRKTIVITGASDGIGAAAARRLRQNGHQVLIVGRSASKTKAIGAEIGVDSFVADFACLDDVRKLAANIDNKCERIDVLANNAGGVFGEPEKTIDGFEKTFQVNHLAPFLLTSLLLPKLIGSRASIIQTSSVAARLAGRLDIGDLEHNKKFAALRAYGTAKLENILFTRELHRRFHSLGIAASAFHPGSVASSFGTQSQSFLKYIATNPLARAFMISPEKGAAQLVWLAEGVAGTDWISGTYYEKGKPARRNHPQAFDDDLARQLWDRSEQLLGVAPISAVSI